MKKIYIIFLTAVLLSCSSSKKTTDDSLAYYEQNFDVQSIQLEAKFKTEQKNQNISLDAEIFMKNNDSVFMDMKVLFGIPAAKLLISKDNFKSLNMMENKVYIGKPSKENLNRALKINLSFDDIISLLKVQPPGDLSQYKKASYESPIYDLFYRLHKDEYIEYIKYDTKNNRVIQYQQKTNENKLVLNIYYNSYESNGQFNYPRNIICELPEEETKITIDISKVEELENGKVFDFKIPKNAKIIQVDVN